MSAVSVQHYAEMIVAGCDEATFHTMRCPVCGAGMKVNFFQDGSKFSLICSASPLHVKAKIWKVQKPSTWWTSHVGLWFTD